MGRTKGGLKTKIHVVVDEARRPIRLFLSAGNDADISHAEALVEEIPATMVVADKGYDSDAFRQYAFGAWNQALYPVALQPHSGRRTFVNGMVAARNARRRNGRVAETARQTR